MLRINVCVGLKFYHSFSHFPPSLSSPSPLSLTLSLSLTVSLPLLSLSLLLELHSVVHQCHLLISAMVHFISQIQYYINFEVNMNVFSFAVWRIFRFISVWYCVNCLQVMECNWAGLLKKMRTAEDLDQIISAHDTFLQHIMSQCLLDTESQVYTCICVCRLCTWL